jgi:hypothetical protein
MMVYKVIIMEDEYVLEDLLNEWAAEGWRLHSVESEYRTNIIIFEKEKV